MTALTVVFDLDGTLVDSAPDLVGALNAVFARRGLAPIEYAAARSMIGGGARRMIESALTFRGSGCSTTDVDRMFADFITYYSAHIADRSRAFPGLGEALDRLAERHCRLAVCTNKMERLSRQLLDALGLAPRFAAICGPDTFGMPKPDPAILQRTIEAAGGVLEHAVMVGDSETDIATARAAEVPVVAVDFGYSQTPAAALKPDRLIGHFGQLIGAIEAIAPDFAVAAPAMSRKKPS
jgi:phosphoglycolate phosphatase